MEEKKMLPVVKSIFDEKEPARCTGQCCRKFTMSSTYARIQEMYKDWLRFGGSSTRAVMNDIHIVALMLIPLGEETHDIDGEKFFSGPREMFSCKHFDKIGGNCTIYEQRPAMCRDYPYAHSCRYEGCTYVAEKKTPVVVDGEILHPEADAVLGEMLAGKYEEKGEAVQYEGPACEVMTPKSLEEVIAKYTAKGEMHEADMCEVGPGLSTKKRID